MSGKVLILGPSSGIGSAVAHEMARAGKALVLAGRDVEEAETLAADLRIRYGAQVAVERFDALDFAGHGAMLDRCGSDGGLEGVILCYGDMASQEETERDFAVARRMIDVNYTSCVSVLSEAARRLKPSEGKWVCAVSSVAGDRGRQSNFVYGSSKAALTAYLQGLRNRLYPAGVHVVTVKPGFVDTAMTWGLLKPGSPLVASPQRVARDIRRAIERRRDEVYTPWFWRGIMAIIKRVPERVFKRLKL